MSNKITCVIDTYSKKEREKLVDYVSEKELFISLISDNDDFIPIIIIYFDDFGWLQEISKKQLRNYNKPYEYFSSVDEYISYRESNMA